MEQGSDKKSEKCNKHPFTTQYKIEELGFGSSPETENERLIFHDGRFNVRRSGIMLYGGNNSLYHWFTSADWGTFSLAIIILYLIFNLFFTGLYYIAGIEGIIRRPGLNNLEKFFEVFFFSSQTLTTVGYGRVSPLGMGANVIAYFESLTGLMCFAVATGIMYGRFSMPNVKLLSSDKALIAPYKGEKSFQFRIANARKNQLLDAEVQLIFSWVDVSCDRPIRKFNNLKLEINKINFFPLNWTLVHVIDSESPIHGWTRKDLEESNVEFLVLFKAFDDVYSQVVHSRVSYKYNEIVWGAFFESMFRTDRHGETLLEMKKISNYSLIKENDFFQNL
ncbi:MAG: ion channel [Sporocytophaga sp.]|nr:ion channel [Sporocytophaga sp.]